MSGGARLEVREVTVAFGHRTVLERVSLSLAPGEIVALVGPSGGGKSTLLRVVAGLLRPDAGQVLIDGHDVTTVPTHRRGVGMVFQDEQLFPHMDVAANVGFGLRMQRWKAERSRARVAEVLDLVGLGDLAHRSPGSLSGGEAKRVALARSLAPQPRVLLADEPLTGLDRALHDALAGELHDLLRVAGTTTVLVTHDREEAARIAERVVELAEIAPGGSVPAR